MNHSQCSENHPVRHYLPVSQLNHPVATTVGTTWEAVPAPPPVNTMATVAMTTTVSNQACKSNDDEH